MEAVQAMGVYEQLGVKRIINAQGTLTRLGGSLMPPEVVQAMAEAARSFVDLHELNRKAGELVARYTGAEAGFVCAGAASGMVLQAAACVAGKDPAKLRQLPDTTGMKNEIIIHKCHRNPYDHSWRMAGIKFVEIGLARTTFPWELEAAINERTAAVAYVFAPWLPRTALSPEQTVEIAHRRGVPVVVDGSAMLPPADNLRKYIRLGADMVTYSGGKGIRGPQTSGILCGRRALIEAAVLHANPYHAIGRPMKVGKEEIVGLLKALELFVARDEARDMAEWRRQAQFAADAVADLPGLTVTVERDDHSRLIPQAVLRFEPTWRGPSADAVVAALQAGDPPLYVGSDAALGELYVNPHTLEPGEVQVVARRLRAALSG